MIWPNGSIANQNAVMRRDDDYDNDEFGPHLPALLCHLLSGKHPIHLGPVSRTRQIPLHPDRAPLLLL